MTVGFEDDDALWRRCENAWAGWLAAKGGAVTRLTDAHGNVRGAKAPLIQIDDRAVRAPDFLVLAAGRAQYWEVKFRSRPHVDPATGAREHWMERVVIDDYVDVERATGTTVTIALCEAATATEATRWLTVDVSTIISLGRSVTRLGRGGQNVDAWTWPVESMSVIKGPFVPMDLQEQPFTPDEGDAEPLTNADADAIDHEVREADGVGDGRQRDVLSERAVVGLLALSKKVGLPSAPQYSVLRIGLEGVDVADVLAFVNYGIRVFVVSDAVLDHGEDLAAWRAARLVESAVVEGADALGEWAVDGQRDDLSRDAAARLESADVAGGINVGQYVVVHQPPGCHVVVTAGAGTGKTETMAERIMFLLATDRSRVTGVESLGLHHMVLLTFTKEASAEMRARIARTLVVRQRLCPANVLPTAAWLTQLSGAQVTTIHSYAKRLVAQNGAVAGFGPGFRVAQHILARRALVFDALGEPLEELYSEHSSNPGRVPPAHEWQKQVDVIWESLQNFGVRVMPFTGAEPTEIDWGFAHDPVGSRSGEVFERAVREVAERFTSYCREDQSVPTGQLVTLAQAVLEQSTSLASAPRHVFIDEFQDTDAMQMSLLLRVATLAAAPLFVVGDAKQGIYRFRGAEGDAFEELGRRMAVTDVTQLTLTKNWRSGARLLESLDPYFMAWGVEKLLSYTINDRLAAGSVDDKSRHVISVKEPKWQDVVRTTVAEWRRRHPQGSIAVLCRENFRAQEAQKMLRETDIPCDVLVGGDFFRSPAVTETLTFLRAVRDLHDDVALLQLLESRWGAITMSKLTSTLFSDDLREKWNAEVPNVVAWSSRANHFKDTGQFDRDDLDAVRARLEILRAALVRTPVLAWLIDCIQGLAPFQWKHSSEPDATTELERYARCLNHLVAVMDETFVEAPISIDQLVDWLQLQVATNDREDEPYEDGGGGVVAITVHKAKGREFDRVVVVTDTHFQLSTKPRAEAVVLRDKEVARVLWRWYPHVSGIPNGAEKAFGNAEATAWSENDAESIREEARLLYVAMTRARHELVLALPKKKPNALPMSWADLIEAGVS